MNAISEHSFSLEYASAQATKERMLDLVDYDNGVGFGELDIGRTELGKFA